MAENARRSGVSADTYEIQYQTLLARPILLLAMVLIAATVSLRFSRSRSLGPMIVTGVGVGFMLYVVIKIARDLGSGGVVPAPPSAWLPAVVGVFLGAHVPLRPVGGRGGGGAGAWRRLF